MSSGDGPVMGKPPIGTPGSRNKTPSTTPRSSGSIPRQTSASAGRTSNGRPAVPGQVTKSARPNSVTKDTEATLRRKIERLKSELDSRTSKPTSKPGHLKSAGDTKSVSANRASSTPLVRTTRNSKNSLSKSLSFEGAASGSKDSTKVQTPPNSQPKASTARRSGGGLPEARLAKTLPGSITDSIGDGKGGKPAPVPVPRGLPRSNSKPDLKKGTSSISDPPKSSSSVSELPDSPASSQGTSLKRTNTYLVKKGQPSASTRVPVIHALPKAENAKTAVVENTSPWLRRNEGDTVCTSEDPKGEPPPCLNKGSNDRRIPKAAASISESSSVSDGIEVCGKMNPDYEHREKTVSNDKVDVTDQPEDLSSIGEGPAPEIKEGSDILQTEAHIKRETGFNVEAGRTLHEGLNIQEEEEPLQHAERKEEDNFMAELKKSPNSQVDDQQTQVETTRSKGGKEELEHLVARQQQEITTLRKENEHLRQQVEELQMERKPTEERIDKLKKRNIELSVMAKRLEEKAKQIQKQKKGDTSPTPSNGSPSPLQQTSPTAKPTEAADFYKRLLAKQRAHYLAENAQKLLAKDKEIRGLRQELDRQRPGVSPEPGLENSLINAEKMHLEQIIKGNAKEQLRLQRQIQLASSAPDAQTNGLGNIRYQTIEDANRALRIKCAKLEKFREENTLSMVCPRHFVQITVVSPVPRSTHSHPIVHVHSLFLRVPVLVHQNH